MSQFLKKVQNRVREGEGRRVRSMIANYIPWQSIAPRRKSRAAAPRRWSARERSLNRRLRPYAASDGRNRCGIFRRRPCVGCLLRRLPRMVMLTFFAAAAIFAAPAGCGFWLSRFYCHRCGLCMDGRIQAQRRLAKSHPPLHLQAYSCCEPHVHDSVHA